MLSLIVIISFSLYLLCVFALMIVGYYSVVDVKISKDDDGFEVHNFMYKGKTYKK